MARRSTRFRYETSAHPAAILIALADPHQLADQVASSAIELARLARGLGIEVVRTIVQARAQGALTALLNEQRLEELALAASDADMVLIDGNLSASQHRTLENALEVEVLDRTGVILRVFEQRAQSREARLQVELARVLYQAPRIRDDRSLGDREGGGGRGGRGNSNVELRKQANRARAAELRRELARMPEQAEVRRRRRAGLPQVGLVGYTNAGKSSWMRALTGSEVLVQDAPFATLDTTVRSIAGTQLLLSDTVGFIADLPHELVASFRATLEEARHADLLLVIADASDPDLYQQLGVTYDTLAQIGAGDVPVQLVLNKADRLPHRDTLAFTYPDAWLVSAHDPADVAWLRAQLVERFAAQHVEGTLLVPFAHGALLAELHRDGQVVATRHTARGTRVKVRAEPRAWARWQRELGRSSMLRAHAVRENG
jgi:GTPase